MALCCLLFTSDEGTAAPIRQALSDLGVEAEHCPDAVATVEKVTHQNYQLVIIDWDRQPEAGLLLTAARERRAVERPLTLAIVSNDLSVPQALQAGANSILRRPILFNQVKDTLTTARDLLRSKQDSAVTAAQAAAAAASASAASSLPASMDRGQEKTLRAGEFLQSAPPAPSGQFVTESDPHASFEPTPVEGLDPLANLEPMAASVAHEEPAPPPPPPQPSETRGLEWYKKTRGGTLPPIPSQTPTPPAPAKPELLGFDQTPSYSPTSPADSADSAPTTASPKPASARAIQEKQQEAKQEQKKEAELFAYMADGTDPDRPVRTGFPLKKAIIGALLLASYAIAVAPQAPWHSKVLANWSRGRQVLHAWLNPQPVTPVQAPVAHEDFARAGDEYKLPVAENIPDATTDPSQIQVLPVVDPTVKKPNNEGSNAMPPTDATSTTPTEQAPASEAQPPENRAAPTTPETAAPVSAPVVENAGTHGSTAPVPVASVHADPFSTPASSAPPRPAVPKNPEPHSSTAPGNVPTSLKSHMVTMAPDTGGNKSPEAAMPSIEPVNVPELTERALLTDQPPIPYPVNAKAQQGTVVLQVLIGRDGSVQDAKFLQGSLLFARNAIDGVKSWKFKPYAMNGRAVSVQTQMTINFKPTP